MEKVLLYFLGLFKKIKYIVIYLFFYYSFIVTNPLLNSIIKFSPFRYIEFKEKLKLTLQNYITENNLNQELYKTSNANNWLETTMHELRKSILFSKHANLTKVERVSSHHSLSLLKVATNEFFKYLNFKETIKNYRNAYNRIIIFDYEGTLVTSDQYADCNEYENSPKSQNVKIIIFFF